MINKRVVIHLAVIVLAVALTYFSSLSSDFAWDDRTIIVENPLFKSGAGLPAILLAEDTFPGTSTGYYRPVTYLSFSIDRAIWGLNPFGFHLTNLLLHCAVSALLYLFLRPVFRDDSIPFAAALLFALHPVNAETVNFLSGGRNTLLSAFFALVAFLFHQRAKKVLSVLFLALSVFSKEFGILLPLLMYVYDRNIGNERKSFKYYIPHLAVIFIYMGLRFAVLGGSGIQLELGNLWARMMTIPVIAMGYFKNLALPVNLKIPYNVNVAGLTDGVFLLSLAGLLAILCLIFMFRRNGIVRIFSFWFFIFLLPVLNIVPLGDIVMADRYAYFSAMAFATLLSFALWRVAGRLTVPVALAIAVPYGVIALGCTKTWANDYVLYTRMIKDAPRLSRGYHNLGVYYLERGDTAKAVNHLEKAVAARTETTESHLILGSLYLELNERDKALRLLEGTVARDENDFKSHIFLSSIYREKGEPEKASAHRSKAEALMPGIENYMRKMAEALTREAVAMQSDGKHFKAERLYRKVLLYDPDSVAAIIGLGGVMAEQGRVDEAIGLFLNAAEREPANPIPHYNLSLAYRMKGLEKEAAREFARYSTLRNVRAR